MHAWCSDHEGLPPPSELDEVFVVRFQIFYADEVYNEEDDYEAATATNKGDQFRWFLSTRRLIEFSSNFKIVLILYIYCHDYPRSSFLLSIISVL